jgi:uncharacterized protein YkwD
MGAAMRRLASVPLLLALLCALLLPAGAGAARPRPVACASAHVVVRAATVRPALNATLCLLNRIRARAGLPPLRLSRRLTRAARGHSREMVRRHYFGHVSARGASPFQRMFAVHYLRRRASWTAAENIAWGGGSLAQPFAIVRAWMHSAPHRANILSRRFRDIGIGIAPGFPLRSRRLAGLAGATYTTDFGRHS